MLKEGTDAMNEEEHAEDVADGVEIQEQVDRDQVNIRFLLRQNSLH